MKIDKWPKQLSACIRCGNQAGISSYGGRALCSRCYENVRNLGTLSEYPLIRKFSNKPRPLSKGQIKKNTIGDLYDCIVNLGATLTAQYVEVEVTDLKNMWLETTQIPDEIRPKLGELKAWINQRKQTNKKQVNLT